MFDGWYLDPTYEHKIENMYEYKPEKDMTVYAKWADAYKLTYDACGGNFWGSEEPKIYYVKAGDKVEYRYDIPSNGDKTFLGWYLDAEYTKPVESIYNYVPEKIPSSMQNGRKILLLTKTTPLSYPLRTLRILPKK